MKTDAKHTNTNTTTRNAKGPSQSTYRIGVYDDAIALCRLVRTLAALIERHDREVAAQLRTAASRCSEGS